VLWLGCAPPTHRGMENLKPVFSRAGPSFMVALLLLCVTHMPLACLAVKINQVQAKILFDSQAGLCGSAGPQCLGWTSVASVSCSLYGGVLCDSSGDVIQL